MTGGAGMICKNCGFDNPDCEAVCQSCGKRMITRKEISRLATASIWLPVLTPFIVLSLIAFSLYTAGYLFLLLSGPAGVIMGVIALIQVHRSRNQLRSRSNAIGGITLSLGWSFLILSAFLFSPKIMSRPPITVCLSNLKQFATATNLYTDDYDGMLPSSYLISQKTNWNQNDFIQFASRPGENGASPTWSGVIYTYLINKKMMWCPSDLTNHKKGSTSYFWKAAVDRAWYGGYKKLKDFAYPSNQIILYERSDFHNSQSRDGLTNGVRINCVSLDSHVQVYRISNAGQTRRSKVTSPLPDSGVGEPAWFDWNTKKKIRNRGQNWNPKIWCDILK